MGTGHAVDALRHAFGQPARGAVAGVVQNEDVQGEGAAARLR
jgi:hypothetical protein